MNFVFIKQLERRRTRNALLLPPFQYASRHLCAAGAAGAAPTIITHFSASAELKIACTSTTSVLRGHARFGERQTTQTSSQTMSAFDRF